MENAINVISEVTSNVSQRSASRKDEITVMKAILNDTNFHVDVYDKTGKIDEYYPAVEVRKVVSNVVSATTKIPAKEAQELVNEYEFTKSDASAMVNLSKEFVNTYLHTGRKLPIGGRENSDITFMWKDIAEHTASVPMMNGNTNSTGKLIPAHGGIKVSCPCPSWVVKKGK